MIINYFILLVLATFVASVKLPGKFALTDQACKPAFKEAACSSPHDKCMRNGVGSYKYICIAQGTLGSHCEKNSHCKVIEFGKCSENNTCICQFGTAEYDKTTCIPKTIKNDPKYQFYKEYDCDFKICHLKKSYSSVTAQRRESKLMYGEYCETNQDCADLHLPNLICDNGECKCPKDTQFLLSELSCKNSTAGIGKACKQPDSINTTSVTVESTEETPSTICNDFNVTRCQRYYTYVASDECIPDPKFVCEGEEFYYDPTRQECVEYVEELDDFYCEIDHHCRNLKYTNCTENMCVCKPKYENINDVCRGYNGAVCEEVSDCLVANSICNKTCQCPENHYLSGDTCWKFAENLNDTCGIDLGCKDLKHASCQNGQCLCKQNHVEINGTCFSKLNGACDNKSECIEGIAECRHNICQCPYSHYQVGFKCYPLAQKPGDHCYDYVGCSAIPKKWCNSNGSFCIDERGIDCNLNTRKCVCPPGYVDEKTKCSKYVRL